MKNIRFLEYKVLFYRLLLAYVFYFLARTCFYFFNKEVIAIDGVFDFFRIAFFGLIFDSSAIVYVNLLFILLSLLPLWVNTHKNYQKMLTWIYFLTNIPAYFLNFIDIVFFHYNRSRLTLNAWQLASNEENKINLLLGFLVRHWSVFLIFLVFVVLWIFLYKRLKINHLLPKNKWVYAGFSLLALVVLAPLFLLGIRGVPFKKGTIPLTITDANKYANNLSQVNLLLNTPFSIIRTLGKNQGFRQYNFTSEAYILENIQPIKQYNRKISEKPNVVLFILEGMSSEYFEVFNKETKIKNFKSYTPFLDSLAQEGFYFTNVFSNAKRSMEGVTAITTGIPTFEVTLASSPYSQQEITSLSSIYNEMGYQTAFFHGATKSSMGFNAFTKQIGYQRYFSREDFNNDAEYNGSWGIHDEPFLQFASDEITKLNAPFLATIFTLSSHEPYTFPEKYKNKFNKGDIPMHNAVAYSDYAIRQFFEKVSKENWFKNTIFCFVADHPADTFYDYYHQKIAHYSIPIFLYSIDNELVTKGNSNTLAQQIDVFPTLVDLAGYQKPFRSWGRSLFSDKNEPERAFVTDQNFYQMIQGNYIYVLDNKGNTVGIYAKTDLNLQENLKDKIHNQEIEKGITDLRAFMQDFMHRIMERKLK